MKNILLTGSDGFIGSNFVKYYRDEYQITNWGGVLPDFDVDLTSYDFVVHLAAEAGVRKSHKDPEGFWNVNVIGSMNVFNYCKDQNVPVIYASSSSIYEWWQSPYATTKKVVETLAFEQESLGLRFHTVYGPNSRSDMLYDKLLKKDVEYLTNHTRDWTHVQDVANAIHVCIEKFDTIKHNKAVDIGTSKPVKVTDVANKLWPGNNLPVKTVTGEREHTRAYNGFGSMWQPLHHIMDDE
tara:strand:- start:4152 stop:4868 length:717 start_codon:yes stop_codon:yes gene_type:complete